MEVKIPNRDLSELNKDPNDLNAPNKDPKMDLEIRLTKMIPVLKKIDQSGIGSVDPILCRSFF